jgi:hypothetical protein
MNVLNKNELILKIKKLEFVCQNLDPYSALAPSKKVVKIMAELGLNLGKSDPFTLTNTLLVSLDEARETLKRFQ